MQHSRFRILFSVLAIASACLIGFVDAYADERILSFHSEIRVHEDGTLSVEETITVRSEGTQIKRGIYRDFPTTYTDASGARHVVDFEVLGVRRDGSPEEYHIKDLSNGKRIYMGREKVQLRPGIYKYTLSYRTGQQIGFFESHDELYWNVTGNDWAFVMDKASARVVLPAAASGRVGEIDAYTGPRGARNKDFASSIDSDGVVEFRTTRPLGRGEGITVVVTWPKGIVAEPTPAAKAMRFIQHNRATIAAVAGLAVVFIYYLFVWILAGKDPERGTVIPLFSPPSGISPAAMRFILRMGYDHKAAAAAILSIAVKGLVTIREENGDYIIEKKGDAKGELSMEERKLFDRLFQSHGSIVLEQANHATIGEALSMFTEALKLSCEKTYFLTNTRLFIPGLLISVAAMLLSGLSAGRATPQVLFLSVWLIGWSFGVAFLLWQLLRQWNAALRGGTSALRSWWSVIVLTLFALPFVGGEVFGLISLAGETSWWLVGILLTIVVLNILFYRLLKAPTHAGRRLMDRIEGFRMFLDVTERERYTVMGGPERTPQLFEKYLPFALALDVEKAWSDQFADILAAAGTAPERHGYSPVWYSGPHWNDWSGGGFASSFGDSLAGAVSSSSTAPGSSSGSGGGGSSGGGGGGGGGGGW